MKYDIFISYRREGGDTLAQLIYDRLTHRGYNVFLDIESLNNGKFNEKLLSVIEECKDLIIILPPNALDRCSNEGDWLLRELEHAIKHRKNIIPVMMKDFYWPANIPESIAEIQYYNGIQDNKDYFDAVIDKIATLLTSKPSFGGRFFQKHSKNKLSFAQKTKKRKRLLIFLLFIILCGIGGFFFLRYQKNLQMEQELTYVTIQTWPPDEMTVSEYDQALDIIENRFEILADGHHYSLETNDKITTVKIPLEVFHGIDVTQVLQCYITRPTEIFVGDGDSSFAIDRSQIASFSVEQGPLNGFDFKNYVNYEIQGIENPEEYRYFCLELTDQTSEEFKDFIATRPEFLMITQDINSSPAWSYYIADNYTDSKLCVLDNYQYKNILNLVEYNYTHDTFSKGFWFNIIEPTIWEDISDSEKNIGENQCNIDQITEPAVLLYFKPLFLTSAAMSDGEYLDTISIMKTRLDTLSTPYAFGHFAANKYDLAVKIAPDYMNSEILNLLCDRYCGISVQTDFHEVLENGYVKSIEITKTNSGNYILMVTPEDYKLETLTQTLSSLDSKDCAYLCANDGRPFDQTVLEEAFDGEKFIFDSLTGFGIETLRDEHLPFLELLKECSLGLDYPVPYELDAIIYNNPNSADDFVLYKEVLTDEIMQKFDKTLSEIFDEKTYNIQVTDMGQTININMPIDAVSPDAAKTNAIIKKIYEECNLEKGLFKMISFNFFDPEDRHYLIKCFFSRITYEHTRSVAGCFYSSKSPESLINEFTEILHTDQFYNQFYISDSYKDENGRLKFDII